MERLLQKLPVVACVPQSSILGITFFLLSINNLLDEAKFNTLIFNTIPTLNVIELLICSSSQSLLLNLCLTSETVKKGRKQLVDFDACKI